MFDTIFPWLGLGALVAWSLSGVALIASTMLGRRKLFEHCRFAVFASTVLQLLAVCGWCVNKPELLSSNLPGLIVAATLLTWTTLLLTPAVRRWIWLGIVSSAPGRLSGFIAWQVAMIASAHWGYFQVISNSQADVLHDYTTDIRQVRQFQGAMLLTDRGRALPMFEFEVAGTGPIDYPQQSQQSDHLPQLVSPANLAANCHGWVFASGRFAVQGQDVEIILQDNDYSQTDEPRPGDLIVYRSGAGEILHSGLVRKCTSEAVFIESKWGIGPRYLHRVADQPYSQDFEFYRSPRTGHSMVALNKSDSNLVATLPISAPARSRLSPGLRPPPALPSLRRPQRS
jgi:hypothetical protein